MAKKLYVGNLSYDTTESQLRALFEQAGAVNEVTVVQDRETGRSRGFGFVEMADEAGAANAIQRVNGAQLDGRTLKVSEARPRGSGEGREGRDSRDSRQDRRRW
ncbi:MAG: RNA-binding protein [Chloroflexi bacterium]|nr:RNA-binding protein [Chloroflexota bacterium]